MSCIEIEGLSFTYKDGQKPALDGINFKVEEGEFVFIMGESGAGKSTLCYCLNGLIPNLLAGDLAGSVLLFGEDIKGKEVHELASSIGLVFQDFECQLFSTNVELEVAFGPQNFGVPREEIQRRINDVLAKVGLAAFKHRRPDTLSGGEKQRLVIASVLASQPAILVLDEPTSDLDPLGKSEVFEVMKKLSGRTLVVVGHETEEVLNARRLIVMKDGKIIRDELPEMVLAEVDFLEAHGIRPLGVTKFFKEIGAEQLPLVCEAGYEGFVSSGLRISDERYRTLERGDVQRQENYGRPIIEVIDLEFRYEDGFEALKGVNLSIREGEFVAIIGQNGSGKTTLVKQFNGLLMPYRGEVKVSGVSTHEQGLYKLSKQVGYVFQNPDHQIFADSVFEEISFSLKNFGVAGEEIGVRVGEALQAVDLVGYEGEDPFSLTKGMRQRVAVASVLATRPRVLIFDEPTTGLDYNQTKKMMQLMKKLNQAGHTIIVVTHALWVVAEYAHRVIVLKEGRVIFDGTPREVFSHDEELKTTKLALPQIVRLSNMCGRTLLSVEELKFCTLT